MNHLNIQDFLTQNITTLSGVGSKTKKLLYQDQILFLKRMIELCLL